MAEEGDWGTTTRALAAAAEPPSTVVALAPGTRIADRFVIIDKLGAGGMGVVYRARDGKLSREVAVKLHARDSGAQNLEREAKAMAQLAHPNVVAIYEVGTHEGAIFIAMELIDGETARAWYQGTGRGWREIVEMYAAAGDGLAAIHRAGLVHRDFKPDNVLVGRDGRARVADLGLARAVGEGAAAAAGIDRTLTGGAGTPRYMAPEQLAGERVDPRADQYAFAASISEALHGRGAPRRVQRALARALSAQPAERWPSLDDLLAALRRDPQPRRMAIAGVVAAVIAVVASIGLVSARELRQRRAATERVRIAARIGQEVQGIDADMRLAYSRPLHDVRDEQVKVRARVTALAAELDRLGDLGEGAGEYALGRGFLAVQDARRAEAHLTEAWRRGYHTSEVELALGEALGAAYQARVAQLEGLGKAPPETQLEAALERLRAAGDTSTHARGLIALYERRYDDAIKLAAQAVSESPWLYAAHQLEADARYELAWRDYQKGNMNRALEGLGRAGEANARALAVGRSDPRLRQAECRRRKAVAMVEADSNRRVEFDRARAACDDALTTDPDSVDSLLQAASTEYQWGHYLLTHGGDSGAQLDRALVLARRALAVDPGYAAAERVISAVHELRGEDATRRGRDGQAFLRDAVAAAERALALEASDDTRAALGDALWALADSQPSPVAARPMFQRAVDVLTHVATADGLTSLGNALSGLASADENEGRDPRPMLARALEAYDRALERQASAHIFTNRASAWRSRGNYEAITGVDAAPSLARAVADNEQAVALDASLGNRDDLGRALLFAANWEHLKGRDPEPLLKRAVAQIDEELRVDGQYGPAFELRAQIEARRALWANAVGRDARAAAQAGLAAVERAEGHYEPANELTQLRADIELEAARSDARFGRAAGAMFTRALADYDRLVAQNGASNPFSAAERLVCLRYQTAWKVDTHRDARADIAEGLRVAADLERRMPKMADAFGLDGAFHLLLARTLGADERAAEKAKAAALLDRALAMEPGLADTYGAERDAARAP